MEYRERISPEKPWTLDHVPTMDVTNIRKEELRFLRLVSLMGLAVISLTCLLVSLDGIGHVFPHERADSQVVQIFTHLVSVKVLLVQLVVFLVYAYAPIAWPTRRTIKIGCFAILSGCVATFSGVGLVLLAHQPWIAVTLPFIMVMVYREIFYKLMRRR